MQSSLSPAGSSRAGRQENLEALRALKRQTVDLASTHLEALDLFYLSRDVDSLALLAEAPVRVGGFAAVIPAADVPRDASSRASLASTAACVRSLLVCPAVKAGHADFTGLVNNVLERYESGQLSTYGLEHLNPFTVGQLLPVLRDVVGSSPEPAIHALVNEAVACLRRELAKDGVAMPAKTGPHADQQRFLPHGYLTYGALVALAAWEPARRRVGDAEPSVVGD